MKKVAADDSAWKRRMDRLGCVIGWFALLVIPPLLSQAGRAAEPAGVHAIFKTSDHGRSWSRADAGMPGNTRINAFGAVAASVFAGTDSGIYISRDEGQSWSPSTGSAMNSGRILGFATLRQNIYAGTDRSGLLVSPDRGMTWNINAQLTSKHIRSLLAEQGKLYAGTDSDGVFVSSDDGLTWTSMHQGLPEHAQMFALSALKGRLYAALYSKGLYSWNEAHQQWMKVGAVAPLALAVVGDTLIAGHNPGGIHWSDDEGGTWAQGTAGAIGNFALASKPDAVAAFDRDAPVWALAGAGDLLFAGVSSGIYSSEDRGRSWSRSHTGLPATSPGISFLLTDRFALAGTLVDSSARDE
jgi:photosystem II stability/assembly factor-like uncharacterized protein